MAVPEEAARDIFQLVLVSVVLSALLALLFIIFVLYYQKKLLKKKQEQEMLSNQLKQKMLSFSIAGQERPEDGRGGTIDVMDRADGSVSGETEGHRRDTSARGRGNRSGGQTNGNN